MQTISFGNKIYYFPGGCSKTKGNNKQIIISASFLIIPPTLFLVLHIFKI